MLLSLLFFFFFLSLLKIRGFQPIHHSERCILFFEPGARTLRCFPKNVGMPLDIVPRMIISNFKYYFLLTLNKSVEKSRFFNSLSWYFSFTNACIDNMSFGAI